MARTEITVTHKNHDSQKKVSPARQPRRSRLRDNLFVGIVLHAVPLLALAVALAAIATLHPLVMPVMQILVSSLMLGLYCMVGYFVVVAMQYANYTRTQAQSRGNSADGDSATVDQSQSRPISGQEFLSMMTPRSPLMLIAGSAGLCAYVQLVSMLDALGHEADGIMVALEIIGVIIGVVMIRRGLRHVLPPLPEVADGDVPRNGNNPTPNV